MPISNRVKSTLAMLDSVTWFSSVGEPASGEIIQVTSWWEAVEHCITLEWENVRLSARGELSRYLHDNAMERNLQWKNTGPLLEPTIRSLVERQLQHILCNEYLPDGQGLTKSVYIDAAMILKSAEYADIYSLTFYENLAYWYIKGHLPCGWEGKYPEGRLIIY